MALKVINLVWERFPQGGSTLLCMLALADWCDDSGGRLYPSIPKLARKIRMSDRQTLRLVQKLCADGWLDNLTPQNQGGFKNSNRYRIGIQQLLAVDPETLTYCPNPDKSSDNPDIAVSDNPDIAVSRNTLYTFNTGAESQPGNPAAASLAAERAFLETLKKQDNPDPQLVADSENRVAALEAIAEPQKSLLE